MTKGKSAKEYDFIVVGSGSGGGVVAGRLGESGKYSVLCLEAGHRDENYIWSRPPAAVGKMYENPEVNWCYYAEPSDALGGRQIYVPRGKMLGGSSSINGTIYNRGQKIDYDTWAQLGCRGWSYDDVLPYFKSMENTTVGDDQFRGRKGPLKVTQASKIAPFYDLFIKAANAVGVPYNTDYSGESQEGVALAQQAVHRGMRQSTATQFLRPAAKKGGLTILGGAEATSLILDGKRCVGVRYRRDGNIEEVYARKEVIISCGAANSPKLLELSGIGNSDILMANGVTPVHDLPGVGENLRDHYGALMKWRLNKPNIAISSRGSGPKFALEFLKYALFRKGFIAQGMGTLRVFLKSRKDLENPDLMMILAPFIIELIPGVGRRMSKTEGFIMYTHQQRTESAGSIHIKSSDPLVPPSIKFRFLETALDRELAIQAVRWGRKMVNAYPLQDYVAEELEPGRDIESDESILEYVRTKGLITNHMVGTCRMGNDPMAVVDERLRVHGITGLRIADASICPTMPSGNTSIPCMMIGEKCADMILQDQRG